ncbi:MAG: peptidoglycan DD-metalloendopeptidase family protein [Novosphingobium sp.]|nr:peptidoglycan DD-metalloendopeptidase family protein [Novosphingobium sp.]
MEDFSFDPRSWAKQKPGQGDGDKKPPPDDKAESLPDAWKQVATDFQPGQATEAEPPAPDQRADETVAQGEPASTRPRTAAIAMLALSGGLLAAGGLGAWLTRGEPASQIAAEAPAEVAPAAPRPAAPQAEGMVERSLNISGASELESAMVALGVSPDDAAAAVKAAMPAMTGSGVVKARISMLPDGETFALQQLEATYFDGSGATVTRDGSGFSLQKLGAALNREIKVLRGELDSESFYSSAVSAGVIDTLIPEFINAFAYDFNLASEISPGDTFQVGFEETVNADGEVVGQPKLLFAQLTTKDKSLALYRFVDSDGKVAWYDGNGAITQRGFMRTPIDGARITSNFGMRFHPVLKYNRLHGGTDFAAPVGTPIYAAADGVITSASPSRCAGNMVIMSHANGYATRYFHLSRYAEGLHAGQQVTQGSTIGYVGNTGTCTTGPHLHYEVHINGEKIDPLSVKTDDSKRKKLDSSQLAAFMRERDRVDQARAQQAF